MIYHYCYREIQIIQFAQSLKHPPILYLQSKFVRIFTVKIPRAVFLLGHGQKLYFLNLLASKLHLLHVFKTLSWYFLQTVSSCSSYLEECNMRVVAPMPCQVKVVFSKMS
jgi:hypothetical protein